MLNSLAESVDFSTLASCIIHSLVRVLSTPELREVTMSLMCAMVMLLQKDFLMFDKLVNKVRHLESPCITEHLL